jgi:lycopene beta-cyclase
VKRGVDVDADVVIVGAGCAGRSVAWRMLDAGLGGLRVVVVDPRTEFGDDRTWCGFRTSDHPFVGLATHSWTRWELSSGARRVTRSAPEHPYDHIPSRPFYEATTRKILDSSYELSTGESVVDVRGDDDHALVLTDRRRLRARLVLDSRPSPRPRPRLAQHFAGLFVETTRDVFDEATVTLMDFDASRDGEVRFHYVLPFTSRRALVESTGISASPITDATHFARARAYLSRRWAHATWRETRRESGVIPMDLRPAEAERRTHVVPIGLRAGCARASTGYAFADIQDQARDVAAAIAAGARPASAPRYSTRARLLDEIFTTFVRTQPERVPDVLVSLFERCEPAHLARFLTDRGGWSSILAAVRAMPAAPMLRAARSVVAAS